MICKVRVESRNSVAQRSARWERVWNGNSQGGNRVNKRIVVAVVLGSFVALVSAYAQQDASRELARNQIRAVGIEQAYIPAAQAMTTQFQAAIQPTLKREMSDDEKQRLLLFWYKKVKELMPQKVLEDLLMPAIAKYLTPVDISEINRFFRTPTGKKWLDLGPIMARETAGVGEELGRTLAEETWVNKAVQELKSEFPSWFPE
jgi:hypothetical protein